MSGVDLVQWLRAQLDEEQAAAEDAQRKTTTTRRRIGGQWVEDKVEPPEWRRSVWDPARVLREIEAKRHALDHYEECARAAKGGVSAYRLAAGAVLMQIAIMALPYADRPGFREEWRP